MAASSLLALIDDIASVLDLSLIHILSAAEGSNLSVQAAQIAGEIAGREVERNRAGHLPTVDVVASYGNSATANALANFINTDIRSAVVALQVNVPVFQGGAVNSRVREAAALRDKASADLDNARRNSAQNARQAYLCLLYTSRCV